MSFNRINYDNESYDLKLKRSTSVGDYKLSIDSIRNCKNCLSYDGTRNSRFDISTLPIADETSMTDIESILTNRVNKLSNSNINGKNDNYKNIKTINSQLCDTNLDFEDTRFTNPIQKYRCMDLTEYHYTPFIHVNGQCEIQDNYERQGLNSRLKVKDSYKVQNPNPIDQINILPTNIDVSEIYTKFN